jgi:hypothetical protein
MDQPFAERFSLTQDSSSETLEASLICDRCKSLFCSSPSQVGAPIVSIAFSTRHVASLVDLEDNGKASRDHPPIAAVSPSLRYFADAGVGACTTGAASAFPFTPLRYSTFKLYFAAASGSLLWRARAALMMSLIRK